MVVFGLFWVLPAVAQNHFRQTVLRELVKYIRLHHPTLSVASQTYQDVTIRRGAATAKLHLPEICRAVAAARPLTPQSRNGVFARFCARLEELDDFSKVTRETHGHKVLPRIVDEKPLDGMPRRDLMPLRALGFTGLSVAYIVESPGHTIFLTRDHSAQLGLDDREVHDLALENLRGRTDIASFEPGRSALSVFQNEDGHDPARVLLLPGLLSEEESLVAVISAPDTLILAPAPTDGDWSTWNSLCRTDEAVGDRALRVTAGGIGTAG